jgi:hypothetical protein
MENNKYVFVVLTLLCVMVYANSLDVPFYFDDYSYIAENPFIRSFGAVFDRDLIARTPLYQDINNSVVSRPLLFLTFAFNFVLHQNSVAGYHLINIAIHLVNACLMYILILMAGALFSTVAAVPDTGFEIKSVARRIGFFTAALFVVHPVMTNAVTYIFQRTASLATLFYLLTIVSYARCRLSSAKLAAVLWYLLAIVMCCAALKSKEIAYTLPLMLIAFDAIFCSGSLRGRSLRLVPFLLCAGVLFFSMDGGIGADMISPHDGQQPSIQQVVSFAKASPLKYLTTQFTTNPNSTSIVSMSPLEYLVTQFRVMVTYQRMLLVPVGLNFIHDYPFYRSLSEPAVLCSLALHLLILSSGVFFLRSYRLSGKDSFVPRLALFGIVWFYLSLAMECGIIPMDDLLLEHRMYLPAFGFLAATVCLLILATEKLLGNFRPLRMLLVAAIMVFAILTVLRNEQWRNPLLFWQDALAKSPGKKRIHAYLGNVYRDRGNIQKSLLEYKLAFSGDYPYAEDHRMLGDMFLENGMYQDAVDEYRAVLRITPDNQAVRSLLEKSISLLEIKIRGGRIPGGASSKPVFGRESVR